MLFKTRKDITIILLCILSVFILETTATARLAEATVIGKVESIFNNRVGFKVLHIIKVSDENNGIATGSLISFDLPNDLQKGRRNNRVNFGTVLEAELMGSTATEYALTTDDEKSGVTQPNAVLLWTAQTVKLVKNANDYLPEEEKVGRKRRDRRKSKKDNAEPIKIWTQEETVRGIVHKNKETLYIKEEHLGRRDNGLQIVSKDWLEKIEPFVGNKVVLYGVTHRTSVSSGTIEIGNLMKIYPK